MPNLENMRAVFDVIEREFANKEKYTVKAITLYLPGDYRVIVVWWKPHIKVTEEFHVYKDGDKWVRGETPARDFFMEEVSAPEKSSFVTPA